MMKDSGKVAFVDLDRDGKGSGEHQGKEPEKRNLLVITTHLGTVARYNADFVGKRMIVIN